MDLDTGAMRGPAPAPGMASRSPEYQRHIQELGAAMEAAGIDNIEDARALVDVAMERFNDIPLAELSGVTPHQMHDLLDDTFTSPRTLTFADPLPTTPVAPIISLFSLLADAIGDKGLKPTATGNLPLNVVRSIAAAVVDDKGLSFMDYRGRINTEMEFVLLNLTRVIAQIAGLIRNHRGRIILGTECRQIMRDLGMAGIYPRLLQAAMERLNWAYMDNGHEIPMIRQAAAFSMYLVQRFGHPQQRSVFYEDRFLAAWPVDLHNVKPEFGKTSEEIIRTTYTRQTFYDFMFLFGLVEVDMMEHGDLIVTPLPLLDQVVKFNI